MKREAITGYARERGLFQFLYVILLVVMFGLGWLASSVSAAVSDDIDLTTHADIDYSLPDPATVTGGADYWAPVRPASSELCPMWTSYGDGELVRLEVPCHDDRAWTFEPNTNSLSVHGTPDWYGQPMYRTVELWNYDCGLDPAVYLSDPPQTRVVCTYRSPR